MEQLREGDVLRMKSLTTHSRDGRLALTYATKKRDVVFVAVLLGVEPKDVDSTGGALDLEHAMQQIGWRRIRARVKKVKQNEAG